MEVSFLSRLTRCLALSPLVTTLNESYLRIGGMSPQGRVGGAQRKLFRAT